VAKRLSEAAKTLQQKKLSGADLRAALDPFRATVLATAKRFGKARFAQIAARHVNKAGVIPKYLDDAVKWLVTG
jgi:putative ATP-dependent endonuclease of OLD family